MKKKAFAIFLTLACLLSIASYAADGFLSYWNEGINGVPSSSGQIWRYKVQPIVSPRIEGSAFTLDQMDTYARHAYTQWGNAGMTASYSFNTQTGTMTAHGGTWDNMQKIDPAITAAHEGRTSTAANYPKQYEKDWLYNGSRYSGYTVVKTNICLVYQSYASANGYKNTITHEMGHAFGWWGHSYLSTDVMATRVTHSNLTQRDIQHVKQIKGY